MARPRREVTVGDDWMLDEPGCKRGYKQPSPSQSKLSLTSSSRLLANTSGGVGSSFGDGDTPTQSHDLTGIPLKVLKWVECTRCGKWRILPPRTELDTLPDDWKCSMHPNPRRRTCRRRQEQWDTSVSYRYQNVQQESPFLQAAENVLLLILGQLSFREIAAVSQTCRYMNQFVKAQSSLWRMLQIESTVGDPSAHTCLQNYCQSITVAPNSGILIDSWKWHRFKQLSAINLASIQWSTLTLILRNAPLTVRQNCNSSVVLNIAIRPVQTTIPTKFIWQVPGLVLWMAQMCSEEVFRVGFWVKCML
eukprot:m.294652 g.294652  ORF g.294652 m.294652 type:complete len:306 (+) comp15850_c0_seq2:812-1729(+)